MPTNLLSAWSAGSARNEKPIVSMPGLAGLAAGRRLLTNSVANAQLQAVRDTKCSSSLECAPRTFLPQLAAFLRTTTVQNFHSMSRQAATYVFSFTVTACLRA